MANLTKIEFAALDINGNNYLSWVLDAEIHLDAMNLGETIKEGNATSIQEKAKAMIFLCHHLHEELKMEYLTIKDPCILWKNLKQRYDHQKTVILPKARYEWMHLRLQDFKSVSDYNSALFKISSKLLLCGEKITDADMLEKTFSTFHASNMLLQQQYREKGFKQYSELISCLLVAEQNNELLMKNHESRPTGTTPFPEVNAVNFNNRGRGRGRGRDRGRGRNSYYFRGGHSNHPNFKRTTRNDDHKGKAPQGKNSKDDEHKCFRCGMTGHWSRVCRTSKHLVDLYQASLKEKGKNVEANFAHQDNDIFDQSNMTNLDVADFFESPEEKIGTNDSTANVSFDFENM